MLWSLPPPEPQVDRLQPVRSAGDRERIADVVFTSCPNRRFRGIRYPEPRRLVSECPAGVRVHGQVVTGGET